MSQIIRVRAIAGGLKTSPRAILAFVALCLATCVPSTRLAADDENADSLAESKDVKAERAARLEAMRRRAASLTARAKIGDDDFADAELITPPLLTYNNPANLEIEATFWGWGKPGRPIAVAALHRDRGFRNAWSCEMVALADQAVTISGKPGWEWTPAGSGVEWKIVPAAPAAGKTAVARSAQIKEIAGRFSSTGYYRNGNIIELRLMGRPLHRYADPDKGLVDGALLAFAEGTNPETLLLIECRSGEDKKPTWLYGLTRMSGGRLVARLGETAVWECPDIQGYDPERPYSAYNGSEADVFGRSADAAEATKE